MLDSSCTRVHCSNSSLRDSFYVFCEAWNSSLWSSNSLKWNQALQVRYSSLPKLFHIAKSKLLCYWTSTHPNPQVQASSLSLKPQPTQTHIMKSTSPSFFFVIETSTLLNPHCKLQWRGQGSTTPAYMNHHAIPNTIPPRPVDSDSGSESTSEPQSRH